MSRWNLALVLAVVLAGCAPAVAPVPTATSRSASTSTSLAPTRTPTTVPTFTPQPAAALPPASTANPLLERYLVRELVLHDLLVAELYVRLVESVRQRGQSWNLPRPRRTAADPGCYNAPRTPG